jgi:hypothetical protein
VTRIERENLIERYLRGEMSLEEEENFFIEVASNQELRYELKAYQVVERAITGDRTAGDRPYTALRARMQKQLAASHPVVAQAGTISNSTSSSRKRWATALIAGTILILAVVFFSSTSHQETSVKNTPSQPAAGLRGSAAIATPPAPSEPAPTVQNAPTNTSNTTAAPTPKAVTVPETITRNTTERNWKRPSGSATRATRQQHAAPEESTEATASDSKAAESLDTSEADAADSISIRFELMTPRSSQ